MAPMPTAASRLGILALARGLSRSGGTKLAPDTLPNSAALANALSVLALGRGDASQM